MEPIDDILIPRAPAKSAARGWRSRHILRLLAFLIILAALCYAGKLLRTDVVSSRGQKISELLGLAPLFAFGLVLWWYAGRNVEELSRPLFGGAEAGNADLRLGARSPFLAGISVLAAFTGLCSLSFGVILALKREMIEQVFPALQQVPLSPRPFLIIGGLLVILAGVALGLARNGMWVVVSLLAGFLGMCGVAFSAALAWHRDVVYNAFPILQRANLTLAPILLFSVLLVALAAVALALARRKTSTDA